MLYFQKINENVSIFANYDKTRGVIRYFNDVINIVEVLVGKLCQIMSKETTKSSDHFELKRRIIIYILEKYSVDLTVNLESA